jgi:hypothetical protein
VLADILLCSMGPPIPVVCLSEPQCTMPTLMAVN